MSNGSRYRPGGASREERLRQALRANLARRKAQARARDEGTGEAASPPDDLDTMPDTMPRDGSQTDEDAS
ncbi:MAG: hypothetical protein P3W94_007460 [Paracoccus sp. (in: a-proteobacteria)]|nr:hypothetical protein [Paracoccus sp. (in: a-proteobacteria)]